MSIESAKSKDFISEDPGGSSLWKDAWVRLRANRLATISLYFFIFISLLTILGPEIITSSYEDQDLNNTLLHPVKNPFSEQTTSGVTFLPVCYMGGGFHWRSDFLQPRSPSLSVWLTG